MSKDLEELGAEALAKQEEEEEEVEIDVEIEVEVVEEVEEEKLQEAIDLVTKSHEGKEKVTEVELQAAKLILDRGDFREVEIETTTIENPEPTPKEAEAIKAQKKARLAQVMTRGITNEKLKLTYDKCVPEGYGGKFVRDTDGDIIRYKNLGFGFDYTDEAESVHGTADGRVRIGDVVLMTILKEDLELLKEIRHEKAMQNLGKGKAEYKRQSEEHAEKGGPAPIDLTPA